MTPSTKELNLKEMTKLKSSMKMTCDLGNGNVKGLIDNGDLATYPSFRNNCSAGNFNGNVVRADGSAFCLGLGALQSKGLATAIDEENKVEGLQDLFLGFLSNLDLSSYSADLEIEVRPLSHAYFTMKSTVQEKLNFKEEVYLAGRRFRLTVRCNKVLPECYGGQYVEVKSQKPKAVIDLGAGTSQILFFDKARIEEPIIKPVGIQHLIEIISQRGMKINSGLPLDERDINNALRKGLTTTIKGKDFQDIYRLALKEWRDKYLKDLFLQLKQHSDDYVFIGLGGGCLLPSLGDSLKKNGVVIPKNPTTISVELTHKRWVV
jgi:hypothetical protein